MKRYVFLMEQEYFLPENGSTFFGIIKVDICHRLGFLWVVNVDHTFGISEKGEENNFRLLRSKCAK